MIETTFEEAFKNNTLLFIVHNDIKYTKKYKAKHAILKWKSKSILFDMQN